MRFVLRVLCLPLVAICNIIKCVAMLTMKCGCYVLSPVLLFLGVCCVFTTISQQWDQMLLILLIAFTGVLLLSFITLIATFAYKMAMFFQRL